MLVEGVYLVFYETHRTTTMSRSTRSRSSVWCMGTGI